MKPAIQILRIATFVPRDQFFHVARAPVPAGRLPLAMHAHDFAELFWVEQGRGTHLINGRRVPLSAGDLVLIRPPDAHTFAGARQTNGFTMVNLAFRADVLTFLRRRYFARSPFPWTGSALPSQFLLGRAELARLREWSDELASRPQSRLRLESFLLDVMRIATSPQAQNAPELASDRPDWLDRALATFAGSPEHFAQGPAELARLTDRCPEHLNRVVRRCFGKTTTDLVNEIRLDHAARQLRMTNRSILDLSLDCGITNLAYFYKLFAREFGQTPRRYRLEKRAVALVR